MASGQRSGRVTCAAASSFLFFFFGTGLWLLPGIRAGSPPGEGQGVRGGTPLHPLRPPYSPCPCGGRSLCRMTCTLSAARRRGQSARIFPLRGRYARLLRRSRVAGITSAFRLAGLMGLFAAFALSGGAPSPALRFHLERRGAISSVSTPTSDFYFSCAGWWLLPGVRASPPRRHPLFFFDTGLWLLPGIWAWSPARRAAGSRKSDH